MRKAAVYARVSTAEQSTDNQLSDLRDYAVKTGYEIYQEYQDKGISGSKDKRPGLDALVSDALKRRFDAVIVWKFDRFARSIRHLINALAEFRQKGIDFISITENIDTSMPSGKALFAVIGAMSEFERDILRERVINGIRHAQSKGIRFGRPTFMNEYFMDLVSEMRAQNKTIREIAKKLGKSIGFVHKVLMKIRDEERIKTTVGNDGKDCSQR